MQIVDQIFEICIIPLLGILTAWLCSFINTKIKEKQESTDNQILQKYLEMLNTTIIDCIQATNQTYVDSLKEQGSFDEAAQKEAFKRTFDAVLSILSDDAIDYLTEALGDLDVYITEKIESQISEAKKEDELAAQMFAM